MKNSRALIAAFVAAAILPASVMASTYTLRVWTPGVRAPLAAPTNLPAGALAALDSPDFGSVLVGAYATRSFRFTNMGPSTARDLRIAVTGSSVAIDSNTCGQSNSTVSLTAGLACDVVLRYQPTSTDELNGTLAIEGSYLNSPASLVLSGRGSQRAVGELTAATSADFGAVTLGSTASRNFTFRNTGNSPASGVYASIPQVTGLAFTTNTCGTSVAPKSIAIGGVCSITLTFGGSTASRLNNVGLSIAGAFESAPASIALTGTAGNFDATAVWSSVPGVVTTPSAAALSYGTIAKGSSLGKNLYLTNTGSAGYEAAGVELSGDTSQFSLSRVDLAASNGATVNCTPSVTVTSDSSSPCLTGAGSYNRVRIAVAYMPTSVGTHHITLTPTTNNGTELPAPITLTGSAQFDAVGVWSTSGTAIVAIPAGGLDYGSNQVGKSVGKYTQMHNKGTIGQASVGYSFSGDVDQFRLGRPLIRNGPADSYNYCSTGDGIVAVDNSSMTPCLVPLQRSLELVIYHQPTRTGSATMTMTPITENGTVLPGAIVLRGTGI